MGRRQNVSAPVVILVVFIVLIGAYLLFYRGELAPPGVDLLHGHEEETLPIPPTPPADEQDFRRLSQGLMPLGVSTVFPPLAEDRFKGVRIASVAPGSPAAAGGIRPGDLITRFNERETGNAFVLIDELTRVVPDQEYQVVVVRGGEDHTLVVTGMTPLPLEEQVGR